MKTSNKKIYIFLIALALFIGIYIVANNSIRGTYTPDYNLDDFYEMPTKKVAVNEYRVVTKSEKEMLNIYFNTYITEIFENVDESYNRLDEDYRNKKFGGLNSYKNYLSSITKGFTSVPEIDKYYISNLKEETIYTVIDKNGNKYIFKIRGVMVFDVFFDDIN